MPLSIDPFSVSTSYEIIKIAKREGWLKSLVDLFREKQQVLLMGSTGVGKTQFLKSISDVMATPVSQSARTEFSIGKIFELNGKLFRFVDTPGQAGHSHLRDMTLKSSVKSGLKGVLNFVSYGYHDYGLEVGRVLDGLTVSPAYLQEHRERELDLLRRWAPLMSNEWIITVACKADIWWDEESKVLDYYARGDYWKTLSAVYPNAHHVVRPYASIISNFYGAVPVSRFFDDQTRIRLRTELFRLLDEAVDSKKRSE